MGRKSKSAGEKAADVLAPVLIACLLLLAVVPFYFVYLAINSSRKKRRVLNSLTGRRHFWLSPEEKARYKILYEKAVEAKRNKADAIKSAETEGITKNKDGHYSQRSNRGRELRQIIDLSSETLEDAVRELKELADKPSTEWSRADKEFQVSRAAKLGLVSFVVVLPFCLGLMEGRVADPSNEWIIAFFLWCFACGVAGTVFLITKKFPSPSKAHFDQSPVVDLNNIDSWSDSYQ